MKPETEHVLSVLRTAMRVLGFRNRDIERKLGASPGYLSRVFSGDIALRHDLIVDLARAMELEPGEIFRAAYPVPPGAPSPAAARIRTAVASFTGLPGSAADLATRPLPPRAPVAPTTSAGLSTSPPAAAPSPEDLEALMGRALRRLFKDLAEPEDNG
jgi:hypothetical protein